MRGARQRYSRVSDWLRLSVLRMRSQVDPQTGRPFSFAAIAQRLGRAKSTVHHAYRVALEGAAHRVYLETALRARSHQQGPVSPTSPSNAIPEPVEGKR